jgi:RNA polymerase sigma-70 factor (sigma-E family)
VDPEKELEQLVADHGTRLLRIAFAVAGDWQLAEDAVQSALAKAFASWGRVRRADRPELYVRRIVIREANRAKARHGLIADVVTDGVGGVDPPYEDRAVLLDALRALPPRQRAVIALRFLEDLSVEEVASVLRCTQGTVKSQTSKALATLRSHLTTTEVRR